LKSDDKKLPRYCRALKFGIINLWINDSNANYLGSCLPRSKLKLRN